MSVVSAVREEVRVVRRGRSVRAVALLLAVMLALAGCGSSAASKAKAMASDLGITLLLPRDQKIGKAGSYGNDVMRLEGDQPGMRVLYEQFQVELRPSDRILTADELGAFVALPEPPASAQTEVVVDESQPLTVREKPAVAVTWHEVMGGGAKVTEPSHILVFQLDGAVARLSAELGSMGLGDLVALADSFEAVA